MKEKLKDTYLCIEIDKSLKLMGTLFTNQSKINKIMFKLKKMEIPFDLNSFYFVTGGIYDIGGGLHGESGFRGCIRNLTIDGKLR